MSAIVSEMESVISILLWAVSTCLEIECQQGYVCGSCSDNEAHHRKDCLQDASVSTPDGGYDDCGNVNQDS